MRLFLRRLVLPDGRWPLLLALMLMLMVQPAVSADAYSEDAVKAAFLYRFTGYVDWPVTDGVASGFTIAVLDADAVATELGRLLPGHPIHDRPAQLHAIRTAAEIGDAQMLYVGAAYGGDLRTLIDALKGRPILVVTDQPQALDQGSGVNFLVVERRVRFEISLPEINRSGLKISPALLSVAIHVQGGPRSDLSCDFRPRPHPGAPFCSMLAALG